jgi:outer membrane protein OmpA-like peptidoglycan-associated protein
MPRLAASFRVALCLAFAAPLGALAAGCDHVERSNVDPARELWATEGGAMRARSSELRTRQQAIAGRIGALVVPDGVEDKALAASIDALRGQLEGLDRVTAEAERAMTQTTAEVEVALSKPNKIVAKQIVDAGLARFATAVAEASRALEAVTPQVAAVERNVQRLLDGQAAERRRLEGLAATGGSADLADLAWKPGTAELDRSIASSTAALDRVVALAGACDQLRFTLTGHVARGGTAAASRSLSLARADAVKAYLTAAGVAAAKIAGTDGAGATRPAIEEPEPGSPAEAALTPEDREARRRRNQRITLTVTVPCTAPAAAVPAGPGAGTVAPTPGAGVDRAPTQPVSPTRPVRAPSAAGGRVMAPGTPAAGGAAPAGAADR